MNQYIAYQAIHDTVIFGDAEDRFVKKLRGASYAVDNEHAEFPMPPKHTVRR